VGLASWGMYLDAKSCSWLILVVQISPCNFSKSLYGDLPIDKCGEL
jgi:hypothetical protein